MDKALLNEFNKASNLKINELPLNQKPKKTTLSELKQQIQTLSEELNELSLHYRPINTLFELKKQIRILSEELNELPLNKLPLNQQQIKTLLQLKKIESIWFEYLQEGKEVAAWDQFLKVLDWCKTVMTSLLSLYELSAKKNLLKI